MKEHRAQQRNPSNRGRVRSSQSIGSYAIGVSLGEGSFGKVRAGTHLLTGEKVAMKILEKSKLQNSADRQRVAREIKILERNQHHNIIKLFEVFETSLFTFLIMENADAGELYEYIIKHRRIQETQARDFFIQIVDGVEYLHHMEVSHRDLKPENLLLQRKGKHGFVLKIVDFGLSNTHDGGRLLQTACGSPCYAAPEMIAGAYYDGPKADIWSMGVILFALVCGYLPFEDQHTSILYQKIMAGQYSSPSWISSPLRDLIHCILNTDPGTRYSIPHIRQHSWCCLHASWGRKFRVARVSGFAACQDGSAQDGSAQHGRARVELDERILSDMEVRYKVDAQTVANALAAGLHNSTTATYHLLAQRLVRLSEWNSRDCRTSTTILASGAHPSNARCLNKQEGNESMSSLVAMSRACGENDAAHTRKLNSDVPRLCLAGCEVLSHSGVGATSQRPASAEVCRYANPTSQYASPRWYQPTTLLPRPKQLQSLGLHNKTPRKH